LGELNRLTANHDEAKRLYLQTLVLDPENTTAKKGLAAIHRRK